MEIDSSYKDFYFELTGSQKLQYAMLVWAFLDYARGNAKSVQSAKRWFKTRQEDYSLSYSRVCESLNFDGTYLANSRRILAHAINQAVPENEKIGSTYKKAARLIYCYMSAPTRPLNEVKKLNASLDSR